MYSAAHVAIEAASQHAREIMATNDINKRRPRPGLTPLSVNRRAGFHPEHGTANRLASMKQGLAQSQRMPTAPASLEEAAANFVGCPTGSSLKQLGHQHVVKNMLLALRNMSSPIQDAKKIPLVSPCPINGQKEQADTAAAVCLASVSSAAGVSTAGDEPRLLPCQSRFRLPRSSHGAAADEANALRTQLPSVSLTPQSIKLFNRSLCSAGGNKGKDPALSKAAIDKKSFRLSPTVASKVKARTSPQRSMCAQDAVASGKSKLFDQSRAATGGIRQQAASKETDSLSGEANSARLCEASHQNGRKRRHSGSHQRQANRSEDLPARKRQATEVQKVQSHVREWVCDTCLVHNSELITSCGACGLLRPEAVLPPRAELKSDASDFLKHREAPSGSLWSSGSLLALANIANGVVDKLLPAVTKTVAEEPQSRSSNAAPEQASNVLLVQDANTKFAVNQVVDNREMLQANITNDVLQRSDNGKTSVPNALQMEPTPAAGPPSLGPLPKRILFKFDTVDAPPANPPAQDVMADRKLEPTASALGSYSGGANLESIASLGCKPHLEASDTGQAFSSAANKSILLPTLPTATAVSSSAGTVPALNTKPVFTFGSASKAAPDVAPAAGLSAHFTFGAAPSDLSASKFGTLTAPGSGNAAASSAMSALPPATPSEMLSAPATKATFAFGYVPSQHVLPSFSSSMTPVTSSRPGEGVSGGKAVLPASSSSLFPFGNAAATSTAAATNIQPLFTFGAGGIAPSAGGVTATKRSFPGMTDFDVPDSKKLPAGAGIGMPTPFGGNASSCGSAAFGAAAAAIGTQFVAPGSAAAASSQPQTFGTGFFGSNPSASFGGFQPSAVAQSTAAPPAASSSGTGFASFTPVLSFNFGGAQPAASGSGIFQFGAAANKDIVPAGTVPSGATPSAAFVFRGNSAAGMEAIPGFGATPSQNIFTPGPSGQQRVMKKATRRLPKK